MVGWLLKMPVRILKILLLLHRHWYAMNRMILKLSLINNLRAILSLCFFHFVLPLILISPSFSHLHFQISS